MLHYEFTKRTHETYGYLCYGLSVSEPYGSLSELALRDDVEDITYCIGNVEKIVREKRPDFSVADAIVTVPVFLGGEYSKLIDDRDNSEKIFKTTEYLQLLKDWKEFIMNNPKERKQ